jgi:ubiquinone/menaquinone biosynthesis C-methylase UbiE
LHKDVVLSFDYDKETGNHSAFDKLFAHKNKMNLGEVLDVGCGPGFDALSNAQKHMNAFYYGVDIGRNIAAISVRDKEIPNLHYLRGDALNLPVKNQAMDSVVSMGAFHHTSSPKKCIEESFRVLKPGGCLCVYLYKNHEENFLKYTGLKIEKFLLRLTAKISVKTGKKLCYALSFFVLLFLSWPAQIFKKIPRLEHIGFVFPLHWGTTPASVIKDLQDRLMSPINHRFSKADVEGLLKKSGFLNVEVVTEAPGHYGYGEKEGSSKRHDG